MTNPAIATLEPRLRGRLIRPADSDTTLYASLQRHDRQAPAPDSALC